MESMPQTGLPSAGSSRPSIPDTLPGESAYPGPPNLHEEWHIDTSEAPPVVGSELSSAGYTGSMQQILQQNIGYYVMCEFLVGTQLIERKEGLLDSVGVSFLVLYELPARRYVVCDFYALKFVTFFEPGSEPFSE